MSKNQFKFKIPFDTEPFDSETYAYLESKSIEEKNPIFIVAMEMQQVVAHLYSYLSNYQIVI